MTLTVCYVVAGYTIVNVPETVGSQQWRPIEDSRQCYSIPSDRGADIKPKSTYQREQQYDAVAQVRNILRGN